MAMWQNLWFKRVGGGSQQRNIMLIQKSFLWGCLHTPFWVLHQLGQCQILYTSQIPKFSLFNTMTVSVRLITRWSLSQVTGDLPPAVIPVPTFLLFGASSNLWGRAAEPSPWHTSLWMHCLSAFLTQQQDRALATETTRPKMPQTSPSGPLHQRVHTWGECGPGAYLPESHPGAGGPCWHLAAKTQSQGTDCLIRRGLDIVILARKLLSSENSKQC